MKALASLLALLVLFSQPVFSQDDQNFDRWVVILSATKSFEEAKADAQKFAKATGIPFTMRGMIFDKKGLRYPDDFEEPGLAGGYACRTHNYAVEKGKELEVFLSIEKSAEYPGFAPGYYIVVAGIEDSAAAAAARKKPFAAVAPTAYVKKTRLYLGCSS